MQAFRLGLAAASASCMEEENSRFDVGKMRALAKQIEVEVQVEMR